MDAFSSITENILNQLFPQSGELNMNLHFNNYSFDSSNNEIVFQGGFSR